MTLTEEEQDQHAREGAAEAQKVLAERGLLGIVLAAHVESLPDNKFSMQVVLTGMDRPVPIAQAECMIQAIDHQVSEMLRQMRQRVAEVRQAQGITPLPALAKAD